MAPLFPVLSLSFRFSCRTLSLMHSPNYRYAIGGNKDDWAVAQAAVALRVGASTEGGISNVLSVKNPSSTKMSSGSKRKAEADARSKEGKKGKKSSGGGGGGDKKRK